MRKVMPVLIGICTGLIVSAFLYHWNKEPIVPILIVVNLGMIVWMVKK